MRALFSHHSVQCSQQPEGPTLLLAHSLQEVTERSSNWLKVAQPGARTFLIPIALCLGSLQPRVLGRGARTGPPEPSRSQGTEMGDKDGGQDRAAESELSPTDHGSSLTSLWGCSGGGGSTCWGLPQAPRLTPHLYNGALSAPSLGEQGPRVLSACGVIDA